MKAVIWTDVLQAVVIIVGLLAAIIQGSTIIARKIKRKNVFAFQA